MWDKFNTQSIVSKKYPFPALFLGLSMLVSSGTSALPASDVLNKMSAEERFSYVSGIVDGLAYARWLKERPKTEGMKCIQNWYYNDEIVVRKNIQTWFKRHPDKPVDTLMYILIKKECGA